MSQLPGFSRITPPIEIIKPINKFKRTNARIHSSNFYQSLKSRWKLDFLPTENSSGGISKSPSDSDELHPQADSKLEKKLTEQQNFITDPHADYLTAERSLLLESTKSSSSSQNTTGLNEVKSDGKGIIITTSSEAQTNLIPSSPYPPVPTSNPNATPLQTAEVTNNHQLTMPIERFKPTTLASTEGNPTVPIPSSRQNLLSQESQSNEIRQHLISTEKLASSVRNDPLTTHDKPIGCPKSNSNASSRPQRSAGIMPHSAPLPNQIDGSIPDNMKLEKMDIVEGLLHKNHVDFASRRSSISKVLKSQDSIDASTPLLFQGIWEKELEENERKWKRLARMSGSQPSPIYPSEFHFEKDDTTKQQDDRTLVDKDRLMRRSSTRTSAHSKNSSQNFRQPGAVETRKLQAQNDLLDNIQAQNDVLEKVWDSFKSEAEISLSDINCDESLVNHFENGVFPLDCSARVDPSVLPPTAQLSDGLDRVETPASFSDKAESPVGLGLFHPSEPLVESSFPMSNDFSPITSPKLKKLSLLSNHPIYPSLLGSSRGKRRPTISKPPCKVERTPHLEVNLTPLDLSLLKAFPAPPSKYQPKQSPSASFSFKPLKLPESPRKHQVIPVTSPVSQVPESSITQNAPISTLKPSTSKLTTFTPTSFSNRPRAQTSGRSPIPPPLKLRTTSPQLIPDHRRRILSANFNNNGNIGSGAVPPVPLLRAPNTAPLQSWTNIESNNRERDSEPVLSCQLARPDLSSATMNSKLSTCGLTPKRPSLLIRPSLRSPRAMGGARPRETNLPPHSTSTQAPAVTSPEACSSSRSQPVGQSTSTVPAHYPVEQAGCFSSPQTSIGSSTTTASSGSTVPSPTTPISLRMTYNNRLPPVPMHHLSLRSPSSHSPIQSVHPDNSRYMIIDQTPKSSKGESVAPNTIKASRIFRSEFQIASIFAEPKEQVSYGMAL